MVKSIVAEQAGGAAGNVPIMGIFDNISLPKNICVAFACIVSYY